MFSMYLQRQKGNEEMNQLPTHPVVVISFLISVAAALGMFIGWIGWIYAIKELLKILRERKELEKYMIEREFQITQILSLELVEWRERQRAADF